MSIIKNNKNYGTKVKIEEVHPSPFPEYLTAHYIASEPNANFQILNSTSNVSGWRFKGDTVWQTPATTINLTTVGSPVIEFQLTDNTQLAASMFDGCTYLCKVELPASITTLNGFTFGHCDNLMYVNLDNVLNIAGECFYGSKSCNFGTLVINDNTTRNWYLPHSVTNSYVYVNGTIQLCMENNALYRGKSFDFSNGIDGLTITSWKAYWDFCNIPVMKFPATLQAIGQTSFFGITFGDLYFYGTTPPSTIGNDNTPFEGTTATHIYVPAESVAAYQASPTFAKVAQYITAMP